eukprot:COSAG01_NODE_2424_length_7722_cov_216.956448_4_plen_170_part_00
MCWQEQAWHGYIPVKAGRRRRRRRRRRLRFHLMMKKMYLRALDGSIVDAAFLQAGCDLVLAVLDLSLCRGLLAGVSRHHLSLQVQVHLRVMPREVGELRHELLLRGLRGGQRRELEVVHHALLGLPGLPRTCLLAPVVVGHAQPPVPGGVDLVTWREHILPEPQVRALA